MSGIATISNWREGLASEADEQVRRLYDDNSDQEQVTKYVNYQEGE